MDVVGGVVIEVMIAADVIDGKDPVGEGLLPRAELAQIVEENVAKDHGKVSLCVRCNLVQEVATDVVHVDVRARLGVSHLEDGESLAHGLGDGAGTIELYRGSIKMDGLADNGGAVGFPPANPEVCAVGPGVARAMIGDCRRGRTRKWGNAGELYNPRDRGTPGGFNPPLPNYEPDAWLLW